MRTFFKGLKLHHCHKDILIILVNLIVTKIKFENSDFIPKRWLYPQLRIPSALARLVKG